MKRISIKKIILFFAGGLALTLGSIGIFIPILPTTPFFICAAGCFSASSPKLYKKLENTKYFGEYIKNYKKGTGITIQAKRNGLIFLWMTLIISALILRSIYGVFILLAVGIAVSIHILTIKPRKNKSLIS